MGGPFQSNKRSSKNAASRQQHHTTHAATHAGAHAGARAGAQAASSYGGSAWARRETIVPPAPNLDQFEPEPEYAADASVEADEHEVPVCTRTADVLNVQTPRLQTWQSCHGTPIMAILLWQMQYHPKAREPAARPNAAAWYPDMAVLIWQMQLENLLVLGHQFH